MKVNLLNPAVIFKSSDYFSRDSFSQTSSRMLAVILMTALLTLLIFLGQQQKASAASPVVPPSTPDLSRARLSPKNATGGTNLYSRNFGWSAALVGLPGRGLDAGFGISYNSLVWTKQGSDIVFNPDNSNITPGFRFAYAVVEPVYSDALTGKNTYLMVAPSGARIEFRQTDGTSDTFEAADSSYAQLKVTSGSTLTVTGTDGTKTSFELKGGMFRVSLIKDGNGNFVTVSHDNNGLLQSVTDTLGRTIAVNYDAEGQPLTITQARQGGTHTFATFTYAGVTINANFSGLNMVGVQNGATVKALQKITFADGSFVQFDYNSYAQVWKVSEYAADNHKLNHVSVNLDSPSAGQTDAPRFTETRTWAENFNVVNGQAQETIVPNLYQENQTFTLPDNSQASGTLIQTTAPDGVVSKTFVGSSGWAEGLPILSENWAGGAKKRWSYTAYTQDNTSIAYILNPRVIETKVGDSTNVRRTTIDYHTVGGYPSVALYGLVKDVVVYDASGTSQLKKIHAEYNLDSAYLSRRIIGLPAETIVYDADNALMSKVTYNYDEGDFSGAGQNVSPILHDAANYGAGFTVGRGNLTSTVRWDATAPTNSSLAVTYRVKYNTAGLPVAQIDPLNRTVSINYADSFDDDINRNAFAYPTALTDPAGNSSTVKYRFETGANVYATSPAPAGNTQGKTTSRIYDSIGRLEKEIIVNTGAYTRYEYPTSGIQSKVFSTVTDTNGNGADAADEVVAESWFDGAGRTRMSRTEHPGSAGGWSASLTEYDAMGRVRRQSVPTETDANWNPAGDDASRGWLWNEREYDWKGRVTRQINTDGTDKLINYEGCGCAGGQVVTVQSELVPRDDLPNVSARRAQKIYEDTLGRNYKIETLNWDGSIYAAAKTTFDGRDQATLVRQYAGAETSGTFQDTTFTYDGHGRLKTQRRPEQNAGTATIYNYNADDSVQSVVDARGATASFTYNSRRLVEQIGYSVPGGSQIPVTPTATFGYDNAGNRVSMQDGMGSVTYEYDQLSRMTAETRQFNDSLPNAPLSNNRFKLQYAYNLSGQLKSYTDAYNQQINHVQDKAGRLKEVTGSTAFGGVTQYADNAQYRAWGALKSLEYGDNSAALNMTYNNRLRAATYVLTKGATTEMSKEYTYLPSGEMSFINDQLNTGSGATASERFDRLFIYNHLGRVSAGLSGAEARGGTDAYNRIPYNQSLTYDAFGHTRALEGRVWENENIGFVTTFVNNREQYKTYDAEGNLTGGGALAYTYDAAGRMTYSVADTIEHTLQFDGGGQELKRSVRTRDDAEAEWATAKVLYFIKSSVLGGRIIDEVKADGSKGRAYVYGAGAAVVARQASGSGTEQVNWEHYDSSAMTRRDSTVGGGTFSLSNERMVETDMADTNVGFRYTTTLQKPDLSSPMDKVSPFALLDVGGCELNGIATDCSVAMQTAAFAGGSFGYSTTINGFGSGAPRGPVEPHYHPDFWKWLERKGIGNFDPYSKEALALSDRWFRERMQVNPTPCATMADRAQRTVNEVLFKYNVSDDSNVGFFLNGDAILEDFDKKFTSYYIGIPMTGFIAAVKLSKYLGQGRWFQEGQSEFNGNEMGQDDFKDGYLDQESITLYGNDARHHRPTHDAGNMIADQVHHFATYFSAGMNGVSARTMSRIHEYFDSDNPGDVKLGKDARELGVNVGRNPRLLRTIGTRIKEKFCLP